MLHLEFRTEHGVAFLDLKGGLAEKTLKLLTSAKAFEVKPFIIKDEEVDVHVMIESQKIMLTSELTIFLIEGSYFKILKTK